MTMEKQESDKAIIMNMDTNWGLPLPTHMAALIFSKLPISNLPVCRCVCKSWNHLVLDYAHNSFSKSHLSNSIIFTTAECTSVFLNPKIHCFDINTLSFVASCTFDQPLLYEFELISLNNCCNGLLYITKLWSGIDGCERGIFNPMTHEFFPILNFRDYLHPGFDGFGFSIKTKQYKMFRAYRKSTCELKVLRLGNNYNHNQWLSIYLPSPINIGSHGVYMNGVVYWIGIENNGNVKNIYALDVETEKFEEVALEVGPYGFKGNLQLFNGTIYAIIYVSKPICQIQCWKMQSKNSWIKDFIVPGFKEFYLDLYLFKAFENEKILVKMNNIFFWLERGKMIKKKDEIKTLISFSYFYFCFLDSLQFGSLFNILAGDDQSF